MKDLKYYIKKAYKEKWAIGQFNFSDFSQIKGIIGAAEKLRSPVILGTSEGESRFFGLQEAVALCKVLRNKTGLPIFLNLDHGKSFNAVKEAILAGYDMVCFDGSKLLLEENIKISRQVVKFAKWRGVVVEGEIGKIGTDASKIYNEKFKINKEDLTSIKEAKEYFSSTKVNVLAPSVGNFHGMEATGISPNLDLDRLSEISTAVRVPLVLHGGSGTPKEDIKKAIELGVVKVNINAETRLAFSNALRKSLETNKEEIIPYKYLPESIMAVQGVVEKYIMLFGSGNKA